MINIKENNLKGIIHDALIDHYITPQSGIMMPVDVKNNSNIVIRYQLCQYVTLIGVTMGVDEDTYSFHLDVSFVLYQ